MCLSLYYLLQYKYVCTNYKYYDVIHAISFMHKHIDECVNVNGFFGCQYGFANCNVNKIAAKIKNKL